MRERTRAIHAIARYLLEERLDDLTDQALLRLQHEENDYLALADDNPSGMRAGMRHTLELALMRLAGGPIPPHVLRATEDVGRQRADEGFPLPALIHSFQLDLRMLWEAVLAEASTRGLSGNKDFWDDLILVWEATDKNSIEVVDAYRRRERELADHNVQLRSQAFARLAVDGDRDPTAVAEASKVFDVPAHARLVALVADAPPSQNAVLGACREALQGAGLRAHLGWMGQEVVGMVEPGRRGVDDVIHLLAPLDQWPAGWAQYEGLAATSRALRLARAAKWSNSGPGFRSVHQHWIGSVVATSGDCSGAMALEVLAPLLRLRDVDGILETLRSYLRTGSIAGVAMETYRHRNTVRNRLRTVEEATGLQLSLPRDSALLHLAITWLETPTGADYIAAHRRS